MKKTLKSIIISTVAAACLATAGTASAGGTYGSVGYSSGHGGYSYGVGYSSGRHGFRGGHRSRGHHGGHGGRGVAYGLLGFGLGMMLFSAANQPRRGYSNGYYNGYSRYDNSYGSPSYGYVARPAQPYRYEPAPARSNVVNPLASAQNSSCLQTREYQMTVIIGGEEKDAYGTACLQPDGSWLQGPPTVVPDYN